MMSYREHSKVVLLLHSLILTLVLLQHVSCQTSFPVRHYLEMGCDPIEEDGVVQAYDCLFEHVDNYTDKCIYKNEILEIGEIVPIVLCRVGCACVIETGDTSAWFVCPKYDCSLAKNESCVEQYTLENCCRIKLVCDPQEINNLYKCEVDSKTYFEGQRFYPKGSCMDCICAPGFNGELVAPYCKPVECEVELNNTREIVSRCAPVYNQESPCCPVQWECYNENVTIVRNENYGDASKYQCTFGSEKLNIGDKVIVADPCNTCSCVHPPLVTCIKSNN